MAQVPDPTQREALKKFRRQKVATINQVAEMLGCAVSTARRRLKHWGAHTSYNHNGRYYALPDVVQFDPDGLWRCRGICFSRYGNLTATVVALVERSEGGLRGAELKRLVGLEPRSFLSHFRAHPALRREKIAGTWVYFSADPEVFGKQRRRREAMEQEKQMPSDSQAVLLLVELIKDPSLSAEQLAKRLAKQGMNVAVQTVRNFLARHELGGKKTARSPQ